MDVEVVLMLQIVRSELSKAIYSSQNQQTMLRAMVPAGHHLLSLVPGHNIGDSDFVEASEEGEGSEDEGCDNPFPLVEDLEDGQLLQTTVSAILSAHCDYNEEVIVPFGGLGPSCCPLWPDPGPEQPREVPGAVAAPRQCQHQRLLRPFHRQP